MDNGIRCINAYKKLNDFEIQDISFEVPCGYILGVIGRNGCGKTTLLRTLMGLYRMNNSESNILIDGISVMDNIKSYKGCIAYVLNELPFSAAFSAAKLYGIYSRYYENFNREKYFSVLSEYCIDPKKAFSSLSTGEQIKVQLAFALSVNAKLYIFDEPTGNLDPEFRDEFYQIVRKLVSSGEKTVIYATHLLEELDGFADYVLWMQKKENTGKVRYFGTADELKEKYRIVEGIENENKLAELITDKAVTAGGRKRENHTEYLIRLNGSEIPSGISEYSRYADLKEIMYYEEKGGIM